MKTIQKRRSHAQQPNVIAYTDETGNTGLHLFDNDQPYFWTGTLLTETDLDALPNQIHSALLGRSDVQELHGNQLGLSGIEKIAGKLRDLIYRYRMRFVFTCIEKRHLAATKFVDTLMDSGLNKAVSNFHYGVRFFRLYNAHVLCALMSEEDRENFWAAYATGDAKTFCQVLYNLQGRINFHVDDTRTKQILTEAIRWALERPDVLLEGRRSVADAPNVVALGLLANVLHRFHKLYGFKVKAFIHDEQNQFGTVLRTAYKCSSFFSSSGSPFSFMTEVGQLETFQCPMTITKSSESLGLQLTDVLLWLMKRYADGPDAIQGQCQQLVDFILRDRGVISNFTQDALLEEVVRSDRLINSLPISPAQESSARDLVIKLEAARVARMTEDLRNERKASHCP